VAVMIESQTPFTVRPEMEAVELKDYALSWSRR
jgi:homogentisate 1,2-dioxygenase